MEEGDLTSIKPYDEVEIVGLCQGRVAGKRKGYAVILDDCTLVRVTKQQDIGKKK